jgi:hypothetical protein
MQFPVELGHGLGKERRRIKNMEEVQLLSEKDKFLDMEGVTGSIPVPPTIENLSFCF